jgi:hypothetical protein
VSEVQTLLATAFLEAHLGFRLKRAITESLNTWEWENYGKPPGAWRMVSDFQEFYSQNLNSGWNRGRSLAVISIEDAFRVAQSIAGRLFAYHEPILELDELSRRFQSPRSQALQMRTSRTPWIFCASGQEAMEVRIRQARGPAGHVSRLPGQSDSGSRGRQTAVLASSDGATRSAANCRVSPAALSAIQGARRGKRSDCVPWQVMFPPDATVATMGTRRVSRAGRGFQLLFSATG